MNLIVFEDEFVNHLFPITTGRISYSISCGGYQLIDWLRNLQLPLYGQVRGHLREIQQLDFADVQPLKKMDADDRLFVNARAVPSRSTFEILQELVRKGQHALISEGESVAAAVVPANHKRIQLEPDGQFNTATLTSQCLHDLPRSDKRIKLLHYPHDVIRSHIECFDENLEFRIANEEFEEVLENVFLGAGARIGDYCVPDTSDGPIVVAENSSIGPYCFLSGPLYVGPNSRVLEHAAIKDKVALGHTTKIGGEIEASIIEPYTNKQHHGFLGHSYLGSWINLGAGTCNSDLKNTYGEVKMEYRGKKVSTRMQFVGCIMGDYAKSAINSGIFTGKTIGTCSMLYGFVTTNVPSFVNYARTFGQITELPPEVMVATQKRMFLRRNVQQRPCDSRLIHDMYSLTSDERQLAGEPLQL